jgi:short-subunit dehydrogenase
MARRSLSGSRILITGCSQGIGRSLALQAAERGAKVLATARNQHLLDQLADDATKAGYPLEILVGDVTRPDDRKAMVDAMKQRFGGIDVVINNAGVGASGHFADADEARLRSIFEVNFFGLAELTRICIPLLREGNKPAVVNVSSVVARRALPGRSEYSASKFAVQGLSEALRGEFVRDGIDLILVNPGLTATNFSQNMLERKSKLQVDHLRGMSSDRAAELTLNALERGKREVTFTLPGKLLVGMSRYFPRLVDWIIRRKVTRLYGAPPSA